MSLKNKSTQEIFLVCGYGIPRDILKDPFYRFYLAEVSRAVQKAHPSLIIFSGGKTDCFSPFRRTEAAEMIKLFTYLNSNLTLQILPEAKSLSTFENLLNAKLLLEKKKIHSTHLTIFCSQVNQDKVLQLSKIIFPTTFSISLNALKLSLADKPTKPLATHEKLYVKYCLWALENPANLKKHHQSFLTKFRILRQTPLAKRPAARDAWWQGTLRKISRLGLD